MSSGHCLATHEHEALSQVALRPQDFGVHFGGSTTMRVQFGGVPTKPAGQPCGLQSG